MKTLTFDEACSIVAKKYELGTILVTGHREKYWTEAAEIYAQSAKAEAWVSVKERLPENESISYLFPQY